MLAIRTFALVRSLFAMSVLLAGVALCDAQQQEQKLIDRLLKPDTSLQNSAQGKEFTATSAISTKKASTKSFYVADRSPEKCYTNLRNVGTSEFSTKDSSLGQKVADTTPRSRPTNLETSYPTSAYATGSAFDERKVVDTSAYAGSRPFLAKGKSQKALSAEDRQLTVDQVRELLNKNK